MEENMLSAKYITHALEKLETSTLSEDLGFQTPSSLHTCPRRQQVQLRTSFPLSPARAPGALGRTPAAPATRSAAPKWATRLCKDVDEEDSDILLC